MSGSGHPPHLFLKPSSVLHAFVEPSRFDLFEFKVKVRATRLLLHLRSENEARADAAGECYERFDPKGESRFVDAKLRAVTRMH